jgi:Na+-transporting methylmalonyl-CoA/oxaloacetate decarboxylase gamma subunit
MRGGWAGARLNAVRANWRGYLNHDGDESMRTKAVSSILVLLAMLLVFAAPSQATPPPRPIAEQSPTATVSDLDPEALAAMTAAAMGDTRKL